MRKRKKTLSLLFLITLSLLTLGSLVIFFPPTDSLTIFHVKLSIILLFFVALFLFAFATGTFFFKNKVHGLLLGFFLIIFLIFRLNNLTHPFFFILLLALFLTLELLFTYRKWACLRSHSLVQFQHGKVLLNISNSICQC